MILSYFVQPVDVNYIFNKLFFLMQPFVFYCVSSSKTKNTLKLINFNSIEKQEQTAMNKNEQERMGMK